MTYRHPVRTNTPALALAMLFVLAGTLGAQTAETQPEVVFHVQMLQAERAAGDKLAAERTSRSTADFYANETITAGGSGGGVWSFTHGYDQFGNMWVSSTTGLAAHSATPRAADQFGATTNRLTKAFDGSTLSNPYDEAGNLINHPYMGAMQYDAENRQKQFTSGSTTATYHYDGDGRRVKRVLGGQTTVFVYDAFGMLAAEYSTATPTETGGRRYRTTDHLGSTRLMTNSTGAVVSRHDYVPFGEELLASSAAGNRNLVFGFGVSPSERHKFTGKERDVESGLDYFGARYLSSTQGRFTSADPINANILRVINPQRWNMYAYAVNNPLAYTDPDGRDAIAVNFQKQVPVGGHQGIISVHSDGRAQYASFASRGGGRPFGEGEVKRVDLTTVQFGANGLPTDAAYRELVQQVAKIEGQDPSTVRMNYFKTSEAETMALDAWIQRNKDASDRRQVADYNVFRQNCAAFCIAGLIQADAIQNKGLSLTPNTLFRLLSLLSVENYSQGQRSPKEKVKSKICFIDEEGKKVCQ